MQREVTSVSWVTTAEFADAVAFGNALPGPIAPQVSAYIGYKLAGTNGAIAAVVGTVVPTTVLMLVLVDFFLRDQRQPEDQGDAHSGSPGRRWPANVDGL